MCVAPGARDHWRKKRQAEIMKRDATLFVRLQLVEMLARAHAQHARAPERARRIARAREGRVHSQLTCRSARGGEGWGEMGERAGEG